MKIYTVGYEGCDIDHFTDFLRSKKIELIADVRKNPVSRKKGFSKSRLAEALQVKGIEYLHLPALGVPTAWRKAAKEEEITRKKMFSDYVRKVLPLCDDELEHLLRRAAKVRMAILCYEEDASDCHRRYVVDALKEESPKKIEVINLIPNPLRGQSLGMATRKPPADRQL